MMPGLIVNRWSSSSRSFFVGAARTSIPRRTSATSVLVASSASRFSRIRRGTLSAWSSLKPSDFSRFADSQGVEGGGAHGLRLPLLHWSGDDSCGFDFLRCHVRATIVPRPARIASAETAAHTVVAPDHENSAFTCSRVKPACSSPRTAVAVLMASSGRLDIGLSRAAARL